MVKILYPHKQTNNMATPRGQKTSYKQHTCSTLASVHPVEMSYITLNPCGDTVALLQRVGSKQTNVSLRHK